MLRNKTKNKDFLNFNGLRINMYYYSNLTACIFKTLNFFKNIFIKFFYLKKGNQLNLKKESNIIKVK